MADTEAPVAEATTTPEFPAGSYALFTGYSAPLEDGATPTLTEGDAVKIIRKEVEQGEDTYVVCKVDPDTGKEIANGDTLITDRLFPEEMTPAKLETEQTSEAAPAKRTRGKATAEPAAAGTEPVATTGKGKTKTATKGTGKADTKAETTAPA